MKKLIAISALALAMVSTTGIRAQEFPGLDKSPMDIAIYPGRQPDKVVRVIYSRPQLKGRTMADLAPSGQVWRTGANENTEITFYKNVSFGGQTIPAGTYSLFTIPGQTEWTIILNKNLNQWGSFSYDEKADVARVKVPAGSHDDLLEPFSIAFQESGSGFDMIMGWEKTRVSIPISAM